MITYAYVLVYTMDRGLKRIVTGTVSNSNFEMAAFAVVDSEGETWEYKNRPRELISLVKVDDNP